jgi:hypothetical protein
VLRRAAAPAARRRAASAASGARAGPVTGRVRPALPDTPPTVDVRDGAGGDADAVGERTVLDEGLGRVEGLGLVEEVGPTVLGYADGEHR